MIIQPQGEAAGIFDQKLAPGPREVVGNRLGNAHEGRAIPIGDSGWDFQPIASLDLLEHVVGAASACNAMFFLNQPADVSVSECMQQKPVNSAIEIVRLPPVGDS